MSVLDQIKVNGVSDYLEVMSKAIFQTGMSWQVVESKWPGTREAFKSFDVETIAHFTPDDVDKLTKDTRIIRNRRKVEAIIANAQRILELEEKHGSFKNYLRSQSSFDETVTTLRKDFRFMGDMGSYYFLHVVGEEVPSHEEFCAARGIKPPSLSAAS